MSTAPIKVLSVEDNELVGEALGRKLKGDPSFEWLGWVSTSEALYEIARNARPDVVCMDLDMPGQNAFEMIRELQVISPTSRVLVLSGHVHADYIDQAINAGAWGYLSKAEESRTIVDAFRQIAGGTFVLGRLTESARLAQPTQPAPPPPRSRFSKILRIFRGNKAAH